MHIGAMYRLDKSRFAILRDAHAHSGYRLWLLIALLFAVGLSDGISMALLFPVLDVLGMGSSVAAGQGTVGTAFHWLFDKIGIEQNLMSTSVLLLAAVFIQCMLFTAQNWVLYDVQKKYVASWQQETFDGFINAEWPYCATQKTGETFNLIMTLAPQLGAALFYILQLIVTAIILVVYVVIALLFSWKLTSYLIACGVILFAIMAPVRNATQRYGAEFEKIIAEAASLLNELLSGAKFIKASAGNRRASLLVAQQLERLRYNLTWSAFLPTNIRTGFEFAGILIILGALIYGLKVEQLSAAQLLVVIGLVARLYPRLMNLQMFHSLLILNAPAYSVLRQARARLTAHREGQRSGLRTDLDNVFPAEIRVHDLTVRYDGTTALDHVGFVLPPGRIIGLVGPSGAGKSTVVDVITGLVEPSSGQIMVGNVNLSELDLSAWRKKIGYVSQDAFLFHDTIANNIRWSAPDVSMDVVRKAARAAGLEDFVSGLARGYDTVVGERGAKISGGQRQRISIARALVGRPALLILDEATSALDSISEQEVMNVVNSLKGKMTIVIVAHRLAAVRDADVIYVLENGRTVEHGTWSSLTRNESLFHRLLQAQTVSEHC
jgi:ABC-type multidrug transport system fused ATPase/permease subunit